MPTHAFDIVDVLGPMHVPVLRSNRADEAPGRGTLLDQADREEQEARCRLIYDASFDGIVVSQNGIMLDCNAELARMFGYGKAELIGKPLLTLVAEDSRATVAQRVSEGIDGTYEFNGLKQDGRIVALEATGRTHSVNGRPARVTALRDVSERRLLERKFLQAQKMEAIGRLAGGIAHDFNNLLTVITSCTNLVLDDLGPGDPRRTDLAEVAKAADVAASLTRQLLTFSRPQLTMQPRSIRLDECITGACKLLKRVIGDDIDLVVVPSPAPLTLLMDPGQLEQIVLNLAVNARDAMPTGGRLTIEIGPVEFTPSYANADPLAVPGPFALIAVSDTGIGMDQVTQSRIFEPFFTTKEPGKGTGLGLSTVYGIVKQNGGFVWVYSEPGQGSTFKIYLPLSPESVQSVADTPPRPLIPGGTETVLLVEDDPAVRNTARHILEVLGYTVIEAARGDEALEMTGKGPLPIHLLVTDVVMSGMSGRQLAEQFRALRPGARVLYMSGYGDDAVVRHGVLQAGMAFLQKPFTPGILGQKVREVLDAPADLSEA